MPAAPPSLSEEPPKTPPIEGSIGGMTRLSVARTDRWSMTCGFVVFGLGLGFVIAACQPIATREVIEVAPRPDASRALASAMELFARTERAGWDRDACEEVARAFRDAAPELPPSSRVEALYMAGMSYQRCGFVDPAAEMYEAALRIDAGRCEARVGLGLAELARGDAARAEAHFRRSVAGPACAEGYINLAILERRRGELESALANLRRALAIEARSVEAVHEIALVYLDQSRDDIRLLSLAELTVHQAAQIDPDFAPLHNTWGVVLAQQGRIVEALTKFERAYTLDRDFYEAYENFGQITLSFRGYEDAERAFRNAVRIRPASYDAHIGLGVALRGLARLGDAEAEYERAIELDEARAEAWYNLGVLHQDHRDATPDNLRSARSFFTTFVEHAGTDADYAEEVEEVTRCCTARARECRPGRLQNIHTALEANGVSEESSC
jgi:tetratricopeptide (TPR) repeat protein